jgi:hypothetical protein
MLFSMLPCPSCRMVLPHWHTVGPQDGLTGSYCRCSGCQCLRGEDGSGPWATIMDAETALQYVLADMDGSLSAWIDALGWGE